MENLKFKTKGDSSPADKPRVFFACHPQDFSKHFSRVCEDLFRAQDCAVYYIPDQYEPLAEQERTMILDRMQLMVIPVTFRLLTTPNAAMDVYFPLACGKNIFVLPLMMESGLEPVYSRSDKFGKRQFLEPRSDDATGIAYEEKLKHYLQEHLISDALAAQIRAAFSAYMFLSYRKKDRYHANILMRLIHSHEKFRDISIWFDEFLIPGEDFDENIRKAMNKSRLFTLLVTPHLLENPNYVMTDEYPEACRKEGLAILPVEMVKTDLDALGRTYPAVPKLTDCADPSDTEVFRRRLQQLWEAAAIAPQEATPMKDYLIGLAYAEGIDMETDRERGIGLIRSAAERELPEAMLELFHRYRDGKGVDLDLLEAKIWAERYLADSLRRNGESHDETLKIMNELGALCLQLGEYQNALTHFSKLHSLCCRRYGKDAPDSYAALNNLAVVHQYLGNYKQALAYLTDVCNILSKDTTRPDRYAAMTNLAMVYGTLGEYGKQLELAKTAYKQACDHWGTEDPFTWSLQDKLAMAYGDAQEYKTALELEEKALAKQLFVTKMCRGGMYAG
jgi:tetratricopeptide (TPR) repeat protein